MTPASTGHTHLHREQAATPLDTKRSSIASNRYVGADGQIGPYGGGRVPLAPIFVWRQDQVI